MDSTAPEELHVLHKGDRLQEDSGSAFTKRYRTTQSWKRWGQAKAEARESHLIIYIVFVDVVLVKNQLKKLAYCIHIHGF